MWILQRIEDMPIQSPFIACQKSTYCSKLLADIQLIVWC